VFEFQHYNFSTALAKAWRPDTCRVPRLHLGLGLIVSLPVLAWSLSGFLLAIPPGVVEGEPYRVIVPELAALTPAAVMEAVDNHLGKPAELTSMSLEQRGDRARYSVFGKNGAFLVDAQTGLVSNPPPPSRKTKWVRQAHFFNFAGSWNTALLLFFSLVSALSTLSGLCLLVFYFRSGRGEPVGQE
jgi:uncharacterized iron-regulated membrane protein